MLCIKKMAPIKKSNTHLVGTIMNGKKNKKKHRVINIFLYMSELGLLNVYKFSKTIEGSWEGTRTVVQDCVKFYLT